MLRATTLLIVMVLSGGPIGWLACELWCASPAGEEHHVAVGCHDASRTEPPGPQMVAMAGCHDAAVVTPFVTEPRRTESAPVAAAPVALVESFSIGPASDGTTAEWYLVMVRPPRPPSFRDVLRI